jgi:D-tyrosyl-tRNA(Tyr) deacylase
MRVLLQRVSKAQVVVAEEVVGQINAGLLLLVGITHDDSEQDMNWLINKITNLRIFDDENGVMNRSLLDTGLQALAVSQFTLYASNKKGNRPSWSAAAPGAISEPLFNQFVALLGSKLGQAVPTGRFGAEMAVTLTNDGPVTIWLDSKNPE